MNKIIKFLKGLFGIYNIEDLPYPMFELTTEEVEVLESLLGWEVPFLCPVIKTSILRTKIQKSLQQEFVLEEYLWGVKGISMLKFRGQGHKLRHEWIRQLLKFNNVEGF